MAALILGLAGGLVGGLITLALVKLLTGDDDEPTGEQDKYSADVAKALERQAATFRSN